MTASHRFYSACIYLFLVSALACSHQESTPSGDASSQAPPSGEATSVSATAVVSLTPTQGNQATGTATFTQEAGGVRVSLDMSGLSPGEHGIHVHENGDCSAGDASSAGSHWNPTSMQHGGPESAQHHAGDLGNLTADADGRAHMDHVFPGLTLEGANSIVGRALVIHAGRDDMTSQPAGDSGSRVACGVISGKS